MTDIHFRSDVVVKLISKMGSDLAIAQNAWVDPNRQGTEEEIRRVINSMMRGRHGTPFESCTLKVHVEIPLFAAVEWHRHRWQSYNVFSGRYSVFPGHFYVPPDWRGVRNDGTPMRPDIQADTDLYATLALTMERQSQEAWSAYQNLIMQGVARELARTVLPQNVYTQFFGTMNLRAALDFLSQRIDHPDNSVKTYPMAEIEWAAIQLERLIEANWPITHAAWCKNGRRL